jgi:transposase
MAPILFHGLSRLGLDARGLAHLARTGFFKPVHVKSLPAHALRSLIIARKKLVGQQVTLENQIRGLAVVSGIRLPRRFRQPGSQSQRRGRGALRRYAGFDRRADCRNDGGRRDRRRYEANDKGLVGHAADVLRLPP